MSIRDDVDTPPSQAQVGMMTLRFRHAAGAVDKFQRLFEIRKQEGFLQMMRVDHLPIGKLRRELFQRLAFERRHSAPAGHAMSIGKAAHSKSTTLRGPAVRPDTFSADATVPRA